MGKRLIIKGASFITNAIDRISPSTTYYSVIYNLSHCTASNSATSIAAGSTYEVTITAQSGYTLSSVAVRHNGQTVSPISGNTYRITNVSGNITVTATATADVTTYTVTYDLENATASNNATIVTAGSSYTVTLTPNSGYTISSATVTHNRVEVTPTSGYTYNIPSVSGNILVECVAVAQTDYTDKLIQGFWVPIGSTNVTGRLLNSVELGDTSTIVYRFVTTTKDGHYTALGFSDGEITTTIPANCHYRVLMSKKNDGSIDTGNVASDLIRTDTQTTAREVKINTNTIPELLGLSTSTYPYWAVNVEKSDSSASTVADMIALGVKVEPTNTNVKIEQSFWANHSIAKNASNAANFVCASYNGGLIPFSAGEYQVTIPKGNYRVILSSTVDGATGTMCRTNQIFVSSGVTTISSNNMLSIMAANSAAASSGVGMDAYNSSTTYLAWSIHYCKSTTSTSSATSPLYAVNEGLKITKV